MASVPKEIKLKILGLKDLNNIVESCELRKEMETLLSKMSYDLDGGCQQFITPYKRRYGIEFSSLLGGVLETYHQLRLKD